MLVGISSSSSQLIVISSLFTFGSSVISLLGLIVNSLVDVVLGVVEGVYSVGEGSDFSIKVGNLGVVFVQVLGEEGGVLVESVVSLVF